jgi:putative FmdB family regulatory protein
MPTYEYACPSCGNAWEEIQKITEAPVEVCPKCHQHTAKRQISGGNFILKGGGWYADLYSSAKPSRAEGSSKSESSSSSTPASTSSEPAKTETKSDTSTNTSSAKAAE